MALVLLVTFLYLISLKYCGLLLIAVNKCCILGGFVSLFEVYDILEGWR